MYLLRDQPNTTTINKKTTLSKIIIARECNLASHALQGLCAKNIWNSIQELELLNNELEIAGQRIIDELFNIIPKQQAPLSTQLIKIKRKLFHKDNLNDHDKSVLLSVNNKQLNKLLLHWNNQLEFKNALLLTIKHNFTLFVTEARSDLLELTGLEHFRKGLQLSGQRLFSKSEKYRAAIKNLIPFSKSEKQAEEVLISYLYRMAYKPSPFGAFTTIKMHLPASIKSTCPINTIDREFSFCAISRILLQWLFFQCQKSPVLRDQLPLRLNSTYVIKDETINFFSRPLDGTPTMFGNERFISIKMNSTLKLIMHYLITTTHTRTSLFNQLSTQNIQATAIKDYINQLIEIGFIIEEFDIPDQQQFYCDAAAKQLQQYDNQQLQKLADTFHQLHQLEINFQNASAVERETILTELQQNLKSIILLTNSADPQISNARSLMYEDIGKIYFNNQVISQRFNRFIPNLKKVAKLVSLLDDAYIERRALYYFFKEQLPQNNNPIDLLNFYKLFAKTETTVLTNIMCGKRYPATQKLLTLRTKLMQAIHEQLSNNPSMTTLDINQPWLNIFLEQLPENILETKSLLFYLQEAPELHAIIINGASMGYGSMMSRFCSIFAEYQNMIKEVVYEDLKQNFPDHEFSDLCAVLGINTNLHPPILDSHIEYPGCRSDRATLPEKIYTLNTLAVKADDTHQCLDLINKQTGEKIHFRPMNFLLPAIGPTFYRFLYLFCPYLNFKGGFWKKYLKEHPTSDATLPRLQLGNIILDRKTWCIDCKRIPNFKNIFSDPIASFQNIKQFINQYNLPLEGFFYFTSREQSAKWSDALKVAIRKTNQAKSRKPHYINFTNPFLIKIFAKRVEQEQDSVFIFSEHLPNENTTQPTKEYLIQVNNL